MTLRRLFLLGAPGLVTGLTGWLSMALAAQEVTLRIADVTTPVIELHGVAASLALSGSQPLTARIERVSFHDRVWRDVGLRCAHTRIASDLVECRDGVVRLDSPIRLNFAYRPDSHELQLVLLPAAGERWELNVRPRGRQTLAQLHVENGALIRLNSLLGGQMPHLSAGTLNLEAAWASGPQGRGTLDIRASVAAAAFSDAAGLHAGDKLGGDFALRAALGQGRRWTWNLQGAWTKGEVFWQPFYLGPSRRTLVASGELDEQSLRVRDATLELDRIGSVRFDGLWARQSRRLESLNADGASLDLAGLYESFLKPLWVDRLLGQLVTAGTLSARMEVRDAKLSAIDLDLRDGAVRHEHGLFDITGLALHVPWRADAAGSARVTTGGGQLWGVPFGAFSLAAELRPDSVRVPHVGVPVLDGRLNMENLMLSRSSSDWRWEASGALQPVSMDQLSRALKWPQMHGTLSGVIPRVAYERETLAVDGALLFRVFDGTVVVKDLRITDLLSRVSHAYASVDMRGLDLDLLTRAFSFGSMQGRVDVSVQNLDLANWRPVRFDAKVESSPGDYPRRISQRAVEHIAALGGGSASAALQRSFLRFFQEFRYDRIGLACRLERNVCTMHGLEDVDNGYVIVKGGGIPAISVIGYNRHVGWNELLARLARIRQAGVKPVVQ